MQRHDKRTPDQLRPVKITTNFNRYAEGSALVEFGHTKVACSASVENSLPKWLQGQDQGWVTAEYGMLPRSTHTRSRRERNGPKGRTQEIQRLIGRSLRSVTDMALLGPRTIILDCDVLQADGGTRTASITGAAVALACLDRDCHLLVEKPLGAALAGCGGDDGDYEVSETREVENPQIRRFK